MNAMTARMTKRPVPIGEFVPTADQRIVLYNRTWGEFETLLAIRGERSAPRMAFLDGAVEIMSPSSGHELTKSMLGRALEHYCIYRDILCTPVGSWTLKKKIRKAAAEPDECYIFGGNPKQYDRPHLAIEVVWTSGGIEKLEIYRRLGVREVWFWKGDRISVFVLVGAKYVARKRSVNLPDVDLGLLCELACLETVNEVVRRLREALGD